MPALFGVLLGLLALAHDAAAQADLNPASWVQNTSIRTGLPPFTPTRVFVTIFSNSIRRISAPDSSFIMDAYVYMAWRDDRFLSATDQAVYTPNVATAWSPLPEFINLAQGGGGPTMAYVYNKGLPSWVPPSSIPAGMSTSTGMYISGQGRLVGSFLAQQLLQDFPFDTQNAQILLESTTWDSSSMIWAPVDGITTGLLPPGFIIEGWTTTPASATSAVINYDYVSLAQVYSRLKLNVQCARIPDFFFSRFVTNVTLIILMAMVGLLQPTDLPTRMAIAQLAFGGIVSFLFVLSNTVPPLPYATRLDRYFSVAFFIIFMLYVYNAGMLSWLKRVADVVAKLQKAAGAAAASAPMCSCCSRPPPVASGRASVVAAAGADMVVKNPITGADATAAAPAPAGKPVTFFSIVGSVWENWQIRSDVVVIVLAAVVYGAATGALLRAP